MRKKMLLSEQDVFNFQLFERSLFRINQLGIVSLAREPEITPHPDDPSQVDVNLEIQESLRNNYGFSAGYYGRGSISLALDYAAINLLGTGEIIHLTLEKGRKIKDYQYDVSTPYLLDYPVNFAMHAYYRDNILPALFNRRTIGANITTGTRINGYWRTNLTYGYEKINISLPDGQREGEADFDPVYLTLFGLGEHEISRVIFSIFHTNLEIPSFPYRRNYFSASCQVTGGILGGDISFYKPRVVWSYFHPLFRDHKAGFYIDYQFVDELRHTEVPFWERLYLGGDQSIRGYDVYSIGPTSEQGTNIGGEKAIVFNAEYVLPIFEPFYAVFFYDIGNAYGANEKISIKDMYSSTGIEFRIFYPKIPLPIRIICAYNNRKIDPDDSRFSIRLTIGTYH
jgi:outer membrane protein insertion porin family